MGLGENPEPAQVGRGAFPSVERLPLFELRANCGVDIMRLQFFTGDEIKEIRAVIDEWGNRPPHDRQAEPLQPDPEPGISPEQEPGNTPETPEAERPPRRKEGVVSDPDITPKH